MKTKMTNLGLGLLLALVICVLAWINHRTELMYPSLIWPAFYIVLVLFFTKNLPVYKNLWLFLLTVVGAYGCMKFGEMSDFFGSVSYLVKKLGSFFQDETTNFLLVLVPLAVIILPYLFGARTNKQPLLTMLRYSALVFLLIVLFRYMPELPKEIGICIAVFGLLHEQSCVPCKQPEYCMIRTLLRLLLFCVVLPSFFQFRSEKLYETFVEPGFFGAGLAVLMGVACLIGDSDQDENPHKAVGLVEGELIAMYLFAFAVLDLLMMLMPKFSQIYVLLLGIPAARLVLEYAGLFMVVLPKRRNPNEKTGFAKTAGALCIAIVVLLGLARTMKNESGRYYSGWSLIALLGLYMLIWYLLKRVSMRKQNAGAMDYFWGLCSLTLLFSLHGLRNITLPQIAVMGCCMVMWMLLLFFLRRKTLLNEESFSDEYKIPQTIAKHSPVGLFVIALLNMLIRG